MASPLDTNQEKAGMASVFAPVALCREAGDDAPR
jgi:hypothetical protein